MATDLVLETLLAVRAEITPELDEELLRQCYEIQKKHQFEHDRDVPTQAMNRLIDDRANAQASAATSKSGRP